MAPKQLSIPPLFIAAVVWIIQMGVDAGNWILAPWASWGIFGLLVIAVLWFVAVWTYNGIEWLTNLVQVPGVVRWASQIAVPIAFAAALVFGINLPPLIPPDCMPIFEWRAEVKKAHDDKLNLPILIKFARLIPRSPNRFAMTVKAHGGGLRVFYIVHSNKKNDPKPWQLIPAGIGYKAIDPAFDVGFVIKARHPENVKMSFEYECMNDGTR